MNDEFWVDRKSFKRIMYPLMIIGAILGIIFGISIGESTGERIGFAVVGIFLGGFLLSFIIALIFMLIEVLFVYLMARRAKSNAYYMINSGRIYSKDFEKVLSALRRWNDRESRHLIDDLYDLERESKQLSDDK